MRPCRKSPRGFARAGGDVVARRCPSRHARPDMHVDDRHGVDANRPPRFLPALVVGLPSETEAARPTLRSTAIPKRPIQCPACTPHQNRLSRRAGRSRPSAPACTTKQRRNPQPRSAWDAMHRGSSAPDQGSASTRLATRTNRRPTASPIRLYRGQWARARRPQRPPPDCETRSSRTRATWRAQRRRSPPEGALCRRTSGPISSPA